MSAKTKDETVDVIAPNRKRLMNLYVIGREKEFEDDQGKFSIWIQKLNKWQDREAIQKSKAARGPILALKNNKDDPDRQAYVDLLETWGIGDREALIAFLISPKLHEATLSAEARVAAEDEWKKDDYLSALQEAWNDVMAEKYALNPEDKEALRVYDALVKYTEQVESMVEGDRKELTLEYEDKSDEEIKDKVLEVLIDHEADSVQIAEYRKWCVFYAMREVDNHDQYFLGSREEVDLLEEPTYDDILEEYLDLEIDGLTGKE